jgi:hypothetical protein
LEETDEVVARAIGYARHVMAADPERRRSAREALSRLRDRIFAADPDHPARRRLEACLSELEAWERRLGLD